MAKVYKDVVSPEDIVSLKNYFDQEDDRSDHRPTMSSKHPRWNIDQWPQQTVTKIINKLVDFNWAVDELVMFHQRSYNQKVHIDSHREWPSDWLGPAFLFPLEFTSFYQIVILTSLLILAAAFFLLPPWHRRLS